jgi:hypothetical protein
LQQLQPELTVDFAALGFLRRVEYPLDIIEAYKTILVSINKLESLTNLGLLDKCSSISTSSYEVLEINLTISINVTFIDDMVPIQRVLGGVLFAKLGLADAAYVLLG